MHLVELKFGQCVFKLFQVPIQVKSRRIPDLVEHVWPCGKTTILLEDKELDTRETTIACLTRLLIARCPIFVGEDPFAILCYRPQVIVGIFNLIVG